MSRQPNTDAPGLGIAAILAGMAAISVNDMLIKLLSDRYPLYQIIFYRSVVGLLVVLVILRVEGGFGQLRTALWRLHIARGILVTLANMLFFAAIVALPLGEATALFFVAPLFSTMLSIPLLGEKVGVARWLAIVVGLIGVAIMTRPGTAVFTWVVVLPMAAALVYSLVNLLARMVGVREKASVMAVYAQVAFITISSLAGLAFGDGRYDGSGVVSLDFLFRAWAWPDARDLALLLVCGLLAGVVAYTLSQAYRLADVSIIAPFEYALLPIAIFWGWLIWGDLPDMFAAAGIVLIIAAGIMIVWREARLRRSATARSQPAH